MTWSVELGLVDGGTDTVDLPEDVPAYTGIETRNRIEADLEGNEKKARVKVDNVREKLNDAQMYLVEQLLENHTDYTAEDINIDTFDRIAKHYWPQIQGKKKETDD